MLTEGFKFLMLLLYSGTKMTEFEFLDYSLTLSKTSGVLTIYYKDPNTGEKNALRASFENFTKLKEEIEKENGGPVNKDEMLARVGLYLSNTLGKSKQCYEETEVCKRAIKCFEMEIQRINQDRMMIV